MHVLFNINNLPQVENGIDSLKAEVEMIMGWFNSS